MSRFGYDYMTPAEFLDLLARLHPAEPDEPEPPRQRGERRERRRPAGPAPLSREDLRCLIASVGFDRVRRTARMLGEAATLPEIRRAISEVAGRHGMVIHPHIPGDSPLVDEVGNWGPNRLAIELWKAAPRDHMPDFIKLTLAARGSVARVLDLVGITAERMLT